MPRLAGPNIIKMGETWKAQWLQGKPIIQIADKAQKNSQIISRAIWLAGWPQELKEIAFAHPALFTRGVLMNGFAGKRHQCEKDGFKLLKSEIQRMIQKGKGTKPILKNTNKNSKLTAKSTKKIQKEINNSNEPQTNPIYFQEKSIEAEFRIKEALSLHARVSFSQKGSGEVRIFFENVKDLEFVLERIEDVKFKPVDKNGNTDKPYWDLLNS